MNNPILPAILKDQNVREQEAVRLAKVVTQTADPETKYYIANYGQFVDNEQEPPINTVKDFYRAIAPLRQYQDMVLPLRGFNQRLDEFDNIFSATVFRLVNNLPI